jgi:hypothetical protein
LLAYLLVTPCSGLELTGEEAEHRLLFYLHMLGDSSPRVAMVAVVCVCTPSSKSTVQARSSKQASNANAKRIEPFDFFTLCETMMTNHPF